MSDTIVKTSGLVKIYGKQKAVNDVSIHIEKGSVYGFIGRNGAGKTTFLKMVSGLAKPTSGTMECSFERVGALIEEPALYAGMNAFDNLKAKALCLGIYDKAEIEKIIDVVGLRGAGKKKAKKYSLGMKQRLGIGLALVGNPDVLILDEPINGLDPQGVIEIREMIIRLCEEKKISVIISSHILAELSKMATHYGIIHNGQLIKEMTADELKDSCSENVVIHVDDSEKTSEILKEMGYSKIIIREDGAVELGEGFENTAAMNEKLVKSGLQVSQIRVKRGNLEDYYVGLTK